MPSVAPLASPRLSLRALMALVTVWTWFTWWTGYELGMQRHAASCARGHWVPAYDVILVLLGTAALMLWRTHPSALDAASCFRWAALTGSVAFYAVLDSTMVGFHSHGPTGEGTVAGLTALLALGALTEIFATRRL